MQNSGPSRGPTGFGLRKKRRGPTRATWSEDQMMKNHVGWFGQSQTKSDDASTEYRHAHLLVEIVLLSCCRRIVKRFSSRPTRLERIPPTTRPVFSTVCPAKFSSLMFRRRSGDDWPIGLRTRQRQLFDCSREKRIIAAKCVFNCCSVPLDDVISGCLSERFILF